MNRSHANISVAALAVALIAVTPCAASADVVTFHGVGLHQRVKIHSAFRTQHVHAGQLRASYQGEDYDTYCVDLSQYAGSGEATETPVTALHNGDLVGWLYEAQAGGVTDSLGAASLQVAIWELLYESDENPFDVTSGAFYITRNHRAAGGAQALLDAAPTSYVPARSTMTLTSSQKQDLLIPEPTMLCILVGGIPLALRRRWRR
ncbi:MAG: hypothetical protein ACOC8F_00195 [Planctomycetota bacterium]